MVTGIGIDSQSSPMHIIKNNSNHAFINVPKSSLNIRNDETRKNKTSPEFHLPIAKKLSSY